MYKYRRSALIQNYMFSIYALRTKDPSKKSLWLRNKVARLFKNECRIHEKTLAWILLRSQFAFCTKRILYKRKTLKTQINVLVYYYNCWFGSETHDLWRSA